MKKIGLGMVLAFGVLGAPVQAQQEGIMGSQTTPAKEGDESEGAITVSVTLPA